MTDQVARARAAIDAAWVALCRAHGQEPFEVEGLLVTFTRRAGAVGNQCRLSEPSIDPERALKGLLALGAPFIVEVDAADAHAVEAARALGLRQRSRLPLMSLAAADAPPAQVPGGLTIRAVGSGAHETFREISGAGFGAPREVADLFGASGLLERPEGGAYLGFEGSVPVATSYRFTHEGTTAVFNVSTVEVARRKGYGRAMTDVAMRADPRADLYALQASEMGRSVYEAMGFRTIATSVAFEGPGRERA